MNKETLLVFLQRLLATGQPYFALEQLKEILEAQHADADLIEMVEHARQSVPQAREAANKGILTEEDLEIAYQRAEDERRRREELEEYGRC